MIRYCLACAVISLFLFSCKTTSYVALPLIIADTSEVTAIIDSVLSKTISFETFSAKAKVIAEQGGGTTEFTASIRMKKDSAIWLSISPALGIEVARILITTDSVRIIDRFNNKYISKGFDFFTSFTTIPVSFTEMQSILIGQPLFLNTYFQALLYRDLSIQLFLVDSSFSNTISLDRSFYIQTQLLEDSGKGSLTITQGQYDETYNPAFSLWRRMEAVTVQPAVFEITFTKVRFNEPLTFPFKVE